MLLPSMEVYMHLKAWLFLFSHYSWKIWLIQFYTHAECHQHGAKYNPFRKKKLKGHFFFCCRQNYADVEIKTSKTKCQRLFKGNLLMLFSLFHSQIAGLEIPKQPSSKQYNEQSVSLMTALSHPLVCPNHYILCPFFMPN